MHDVAAVVHVHSTYSDGTASVPEIAAAAAAGGADAVLVTDHDSLGALRDGCEGWHHGVLVLVGLEVSPKGGHLLAFGVSDEIDHRGRSELELCDAVRAGGGLAFPAHPFSRGSRISRTVAPPHGWSELERCALTGIELWSLVTDAAESCTSLRELWDLARRPERFLDGPPRENLATWDRLCAQRRVVALGGLDAHQTGLRLPGGHVLSPFPHERFFTMLRTHFLCEEPFTGALDHDREQILLALAEGRCYLAVDRLAPARGFAFWGERNDGTRLEMGGEERAGEWGLRCRLPRPAAVTLVRDGQALDQARGRAFEWPVREPGVYRVEASLEAYGRERAWVFSNPLYLRT